MPEIRICGLIPVYNNPLTIAKVAEGLRAYVDDVVVVDDGSDEDTQSIVDHLAETNPEHVRVLHLPKNRGKGAAVQAGLVHANTLGFTHALQIDADGQHDLRDTPRFLEAVRAQPEAVILGAPIFDDDIPAIRKHGRKLTQWMVALEAGSLQLPDAMCGFRVYPVAAICALGRLSSRMSYDPEVLIRAHWAGIPLVKIPTRIRYLSAEEGGVSHFRMVHDNLLHVWTHTRLILQAPARWLVIWTKR